MKRKIRTQRSLIESIKDSIIPYVANLEKLKDIYDKSVELFSISTAG